MHESVAIETVMDKLPVAELEETLSEFVAPFQAVLPDARLRQVVPLAVRGIVAGESPVVTAMAQSVQRTESSPWAAAKRIYRFLGNPRLGGDLLQEGLYECARATIAQEKPHHERLVVALDPVNFEKPYTHKLQGVSALSIRARLRSVTARRAWPAAIRRLRPRSSTHGCPPRPTLTGSPIEPRTSSARTARSTGPSPLYPPGISRAAVAFRRR